MATYYKQGEQVVIKISRDHPLYMMQREERKGAWLQGTVDYVGIQIVVFYVPKLQTDRNQLVITDAMNNTGITVVKKVPASKWNHK